MIEKGNKISSQQAVLSISIIRMTNVRAAPYVEKYILMEDLYCPESGSKLSVLREEEVNNGIRDSIDLKNANVESCTI